MRDKKERRHRRTWMHPECVKMMAGADFENTMSLSAAMGLLPCIHAGVFPCEQCVAGREGNEAATGKKLTDAEFERRFARGGD